MKVTKFTMKRKFIPIAVLIGICVITASAYFGYGATMININNETSIKNHLSTDKSQPINILATQEYKNQFFILYTDPVVLEKSPNAYSLSEFSKHKLYKNRYQCISTSGTTNDAMVIGGEVDKVVTAEKALVTCIVANVVSKETKCSIFEFDMEKNCYVKRLAVLDVPTKKPYIMLKEFELQDKENDVVVFDGDISLKYLTEGE